MIVHFVIAAALLLGQIPENHQSSLPADEGDLHNQTYMPTLYPNISSLVAQALQALREDQVRRAFEILQRISLYRASLDDQATLSLMALDERVALDVQEYLEVQIAALPNKVREHFVEAVREAAQTALASAGRQEDLLHDIIQHFPVTPFAAQAMIQLGDLALEKGDYVAAASHYQNTQRYLVFGVAPEGLQLEQLQARQDFAATQLSAMSQNTTKNPACSNAKELSWQTQLPPESPSSPIWSQPLSDAENRIVIQTPQFLHFLSPTGEVQETLNLDTLLLDRSRLLHSYQEKKLLNKVRILSPQIGNWNDATLYFVVHGDTSAPNYANVLAALTNNCEIKWMHGWQQETNNPELQGFTYSPELLLYGDRLYIGAQNIKEEISSYLLCFQAQSGELLWKRLLAKGSSLDQKQERLVEVNPLDVWGTQPRIVNNILFYCTNLGLLCALDPNRGTILWELRYARAAQEGAGWNYAALQTDSTNALTLAPLDSDWLYSFRAERIQPLTPFYYSLWTRAPTQRREAILYLGSTATGPCLVQRGHGDRLIQILSKTGQQLSALALPQQNISLGWNFSPECAILLDPQQIYFYALKQDLLLQNVISFDPLELKQNENLFVILPTPLPQGLVFGVSNRVGMLALRK